MYTARKFCILFVFVLFSCINRNPVSQAEQPVILELSQMEMDLAFILETYDPFLWILVDKQHALPADYAPSVLVPLTGRNVLYRTNRNDLLLCRPAFDSLEEMAAAARADGLTLTVSSAYRSYAYQEQVYLRYVRQYGREEADTFSARPGHSQHQLGLVVDFGSITDAFADTPEGKWLAANASNYGWSLSYPLGYEHITGYKWESWHYRYVGKELARFIDTYFDGIQQNALLYINKTTQTIN
ncbi:MAG: M15 family metallopeptidase [Treponema sp.]|jgi:D-alanyl-D-alanine carboxypeptidase|nr:M15 family metallopeptidase [Treponema sp.]